MATTKESTVKPQEQLEEAYHLAEQATTEAVGAPALGLSLGFNSTDGD